MRSKVKLHDILDGGRMPTFHHRHCLLLLLALTFIFQNRSSTSVSAANAYFQRECWQSGQTQLASTLGAKIGPHGDYSQVEAAYNFVNNY